MNENPSSPAENETAELPRDIDRVDASDWQERAFPIDDGRRQTAVRVVMKQSVLNDIHKHGQADTSVEICGVIIGQGYYDEHGPFIYVEGNIRGQHSDSKAAQVTFTGETWNHIHNELDNNHPDLKILGWYHTHPGFGIFLSGMDLFIHENYFSAEHQLAFVYDPIGGDEGLFVWRNGKAIRDGYLIEPDQPEDPPPVATQPRSEPVTAGASDEPVLMSTSSPAVDSRLALLEKRVQYAEYGVFAALCFLVLLPIIMWFLWINPLMQSQQQPQQPGPIFPIEDTEPTPSPRQGPIFTDDEDDPMMKHVVDGLEQTDPSEPFSIDHDEEPPSVD